MTARISFWLVGVCAVRLVVVSELLRLKHSSLGFVHKLVVDGAGEAVGEAHRGDKAGVGDTGGGKVGVLAELLHPDGANGEPPPQNQCQKVKAQAAKIRHGIGPVEQPGLGSAQSPVHLQHQAVHVVGGLVAVVVQVLLLRRAALGIGDSILVGRQLLLHTMLDEGGHILHIVHGLSVCAPAHHGEPAAGNLAQQVVDVAPVPLAKDNGGADDDHPVLGVGFEPLAVLLLRKPFGAAIVVEVVDFP